MTVRITQEYLDQHRTDRGAWTYMQMAAIGVKWPQAKGWRKAIEGTEISDEQARAFEAAKAVFSAKTLRKQNAKAVELLKLAGQEIPAELLPKPQPVLSAKAARLAEKAARRRAKKLARVQALERKLAAAKKPQPKTLPAPLPYQGDVTADAFLASFQWRQLRMKVLKHYGRRCMCCGASPDSGAVMHVDHIKPRRLFPKLALDFGNLQVLCHECNHGKGNWDHTDWRHEEEFEVDPSVREFIRDIARSA